MGSRLRSWPGWSHIRRLRLTPLNHWFGRVFPSANSTFFHIALYSSGIVVIAVECFAATMLSYLDGLTREDLKTSAHMLANLVGSSIADDLRLDQQSAVVNRCQQLVNLNPELSYVIVTSDKKPALVHRKEGWSLDRSESRWKQWEPLGGKVAQFIADPFSGKGELLHYGLQLRGPEQQPIGWVHVGYSLASYRQSMVRFQIRVFWMGLLALATGVLASLAFSSNFTRPLVRLQRFVEGVAQGDFEARVQVAGSKEIENLAETINWMTGRLAESRSQFEESLKQQATLREKEILLREIHHRVKNNMQILASLIRIQCRGLKNEETRKILKESESRIRSMALLHQKLHQSANFAEICFAAYIQALVSHLRHAYQGNSSRALVSVEIPNEFRLGLDTALPCGLIINELVSNAFKYAFPKGRAGVIRVAISGIRGERFTLLVEDDGVGLPPDFDPEESRSLGTRLVAMLVEQLNGKLSVQYRGPTRFILDLKSAHYSDRIAKAA